MNYTYNKEYNNKKYKRTSDMMVGLHTFEVNRQC